METGKKDEYLWVTEEFSIDDLLDRCPEIVRGRRVAVTAFDSGPLTLTVEEQRCGWSHDENVAWSPEIISPGILPREQYDEWYIFTQLRRFKPDEIFVNFGNFGLSDPAHRLENLDLTWDRSLAIDGVARIRGIQNRFWSQLSSINPESYLASGDKLTFATKNVYFYGRVVTSLGN